MNPILARCLKFAGMLSSASLLWGCAGTHIYRQADHDLATKAEASFKAAKISQTLTEERKQLDALAERELAVVRRQTLALRDAWLIEIAGRTNASIAADDLTTQIDQRLQGLTGDLVLTNLIPLMEGIQQKKSQKENAAQLYRIQRASGDPKRASSYPTLPANPGTDEEIAKLRGKLSAPLAAIFDQYISRDRELVDLQTQFEKLAGSDTSSQLGRLTASLHEIDQLKKDFSKDLADRKSAFEVAKKTYDDALAAHQTNEITRAAQQLTNALIQLEIKAGPIISHLQAVGFGDLGLEGTITKLEEQKAAVLGLVDLLIDDKTKTNTLKQAAGQPVLLFLAGLLPSIREQVGNQIMHPSIASLLLKQQQLSAELEAANRALNHAKKRYDLLQEKRAFMTSEISSLFSARRGALQLADDLSKAGPKISGVLLPAALNQLSPDQSENGYQALVDYSLSWAFGRAGEEAADYKIIAERHQAALDSSDIALLEWDNLIGVPLSQLVALHGSGIKPEMIANLISSAGVSAAIGAK